MVTDAHELMHRRKPTNNRMITDMHMPSQRRIIRENDSITDITIMRHMRAHHKQAIIANDRDHTATFGARIHRHMFADFIAFADSER